MATYNATWEDQHRNRRVEMALDYTLESGHVELKQVVPQRVVLLDGKTGAEVRTVRVWTDGGRRVLAAQAERAGWTETARELITNRAVHDVLHTAPEGQAAETEPSMKA